MAALNHSEMDRIRHLKQPDLRFLPSTLQQFLLLLFLSSGAGAGAALPAVSGLDPPGSRGTPGSQRGTAGSSTHRSRRSREGAPGSIREFSVRLRVPGTACGSCSTSQGAFPVSRPAGVVPSRVQVLCHNMMSWDERN